jgi:hypothetical protein
VLLNRPAFIGVSLDSDLFCRQWIRSALAYVLSRHAELLFVLGDGLLAFNKCISHHLDGQLVLDLEAAERKISKRTEDIYQLCFSEVRRLPKAEQARVSIHKWAEYCDNRFVEIARTLKIAYSAIESFRDCVHRDVAIHLDGLAENHYPAELHERLCALYVIEETAMIIRITEEHNPYEYYPRQHIQTLTDTYAGKFAAQGLTVEGLVHHPHQRVFSALPLRNGNAEGGGEPL